MISEIKQWANAGLNFIYPEVCNICSKERACATQGFVCAACQTKVRFVTEPFCERCGLPFDGDITSKFECYNCRDMKLHFAGARSAVSINDLMLDVIHRYKYQSALWFEPFLAGLLIGAAQPLLSPQNCVMIVPVPLHHAKLRERGFNQAERLAACLSRATKIPLNTKLLKRVEPTRTQTLLTREERAANVRGAFALLPGAKVNGGCVVVIDDVFTTGATTSSCARMLLSAGADEVRVWTVARGL